MAEFEREYPSLGICEHHETPFQVIRLAEHRSINEVVPLRFSVQAYVDGHDLSATAETAKDAFAKAIEWRIVGGLADVSINDGTRSYSIVEFSSLMALAEIENIIKYDISAD